MTAGQVFAVTSGTGLIGYGVTLHFARPVALPLGTPINPTVSEDDDSSHSPIPLARDLPPATTWIVILNLDGTVNRAESAPR